MNVWTRSAATLVITLAAILISCSPATLEETPSSAASMVADPTAAAEPSGAAAAQGITVDVQPPASTIVAGEAVAFTASVYGTAEEGVSWSVAEDGGGTVDQGHYVAPSTPGTYHVIARSTAQAAAFATGTVTVTAVPVASVATPAPVISSLTATPASITSGASATLVWTTSSVNSATISPGVGTVAANGSVRVTPATTTTYTLTVRGAGGTASKPVQVTVTPPVPTGSAPTIAAFTATPASIAPGGSTTLAWTAIGATTLTVDNGVGDVTSAASKAVAPAATTTYRLTATNASGSTTAAMTVTVQSAPTAPPPSPLAIAPASASVSPGGSRTFTVSNGTPPYSWTLSANGSGSTTLSGSGTSFAYTAGATGGTADRVDVHDATGATASATVSISGAQPSGRFSTAYWKSDMQAPTSIRWSAWTNIAHMTLCANADGSLQIQDGSNPNDIVGVAHAHGRKVLADMGAYCWGSFGQDNFATIAASPSLRSTFAANVAKFVASGGYDGIVIDWEAGVTSDYGVFAAALRNALGSGALIGASIQCNYLSEFALGVPYVDQFYPMTYYWAPPESFFYSYMSDVAGAGIPKAKTAVGFGTDPGDCVNTGTECKPEVTDAASQQAKADWAVANGYGGFMIWRLADTISTVEPIIDAKMAIP